MAIDPRSGFPTVPFPTDLPRRRPDQPIPDDILDRPAVDELGMAEDIDQRSPMFWLPIAITIAIALLIGVAYYFFGPHTGPNVPADAGAVTKIEPRPN
jgi:hypothetical protein